METFDGGINIRRSDPLNANLIVISLSADSGEATIGAHERAGQLRINDKDGKTQFAVDGASGKVLIAGDLLSTGQIVLEDNNHTEIVRLGAQSSVDRLTADVLEVQKATRLGGVVKLAQIVEAGAVTGGQVVILNASGNQIAVLGAQSSVDRLTADVLEVQKETRLGGVVKLAQILEAGAVTGGQVVILNVSGNQIAALGAATTIERLQAGLVELKPLAQASEAKLVVTDANGRTVATLSADSVVNSLTANLFALAAGGRLVVRDETNKEIASYGESARVTSLTATDDIFIEKGADAAEEFDVSDFEQVEPGEVVTLDPLDGRLRRCSQEYDTRVAGVISGAGSYRPGIILDRQRPGLRPRVPVALMGKVFCKVTVTDAPIRPGDLLTSSTVPGHAMRAALSERAFGAVIGKALGGLDVGTGLIPILVTLR